MTFPPLRTPKLPPPFPGRGVVWDMSILTDAKGNTVSKVAKSFEDYMTRKKLIQFHRRAANTVLGLSIEDSPSTKYLKRALNRNVTLARIDQGQIRVIVLVSNGSLEIVRAHTKVSTKDQDKHIDQSINLVLSKKASQ